MDVVQLVPLEGQLIGISVVWMVKTIYKIVTTSFSFCYLADSQKGPDVFSTFPPYEFNTGPER